ncbi:hypothetical protein A6768_08105 [Sphingobium yanoikuyae]|uniref:DUF6438 domain-containing protein n=2 Tax=Sphingobium yanoikuyae TaxID=13690 RepID=A0A291MY07_SPHYA|nr:hypothetical protein A6768_08105 [Sphingobium yanoikuyae]
MTQRMGSALVSLLALGACATVPGSPGEETEQGSGPRKETIAVSVGPCFGFCPVYDAKIAPDGTVTFHGERHTATLGDKSRVAGKGTYASISASLAPFRPTDGTTGVVPCDAAISDMSSYTITWTDAQGLKTVATHQQGCSGGPGQALDRILKDLPDRLGISAWAKQITRPGTSRG